MLQEIKIKKECVIYVPLLDLMYALYYLDVKKWGDFQQTYKETFLMALCLLHILPEIKGSNRLHRNLISNSESTIK
mgnify:CR=1 FL=1